MDIPDMQHLENTLDVILEQVWRTFNLPGLAVGVVRESEIVYAKGFGVRDIRTQERVTARSLFHQASISKLFTATAVMQFIELGQVRLDDPIAKYLSNFWLGDERSQSITVEHVLTHTSGMPDPEDHDWEHPEYDENALMRYVNRLHSLQMIADPGQDFAYSSLGFNVLGALITEVSGEPFEAYIKHHIFEPLGMCDSTFLKPDVPFELATSPHIRTPRLTVSDVFPYSRPHAPSGALQSSAWDMCQWALANLNGGALNSCRNSSHHILSPEIHRLLWQPRTRTGQDHDSRQTRIGLGWFTGEYKGMPTVMHDGGDIGYETELTLLPEQSVAVTVMANVFPAVTADITRVVLDAVLGFGVQMPRPPLLLPLMAKLGDTGFEAAVADYRKMDQDSPDANMTFLRDSIFILQEAHRPEEASELLKLAALLYPETEMEHREET